MSQSVIHVYMFTLLNVHCTYIITEPTKGPGNVQVMSIQRTAVTLLWKPIPCDDQNGKIQRYWIQYDRIIPSGSMSHEYVQTTGNTNGFILHNLHPNSRYSLRVAGVNAAGIGVYSSPVGFITPGGKL